MPSDDPTAATNRPAGPAADPPDLPPRKAVVPLPHGSAAARAAAEVLEPYEPPQLMKFEKLDRLIVSGE